MRTRTKSTLWFYLAVSLLLASQVLAQNPTATLKGKVSDDSGAGLAGVTVVATSPNLQGERRTLTGNNGDYKLAFMPPGEYRVVYELVAFVTKVRAVRLSAAQSSTSDIVMELAERSELVEEIIVNSSLETISGGTTAVSTYSTDEIEKLAIRRNIEDAVNLAPGVHNTAVGSSRNISINGAMSFENVFMVNGVVINENLRGQSLPLFVEDAIQETSVTTSGISAEYGRFTGGVVNVLTKSGGNTFSGSLRVNFANDDWEAKTPVTNDRADILNEIYEATLGGPIWRDKIWFFGSFRDRAESGTDQTDTTNLTIVTGTDETRLEGKLTATPHPSHQIQGSYLDLERTTSGVGFSSVRQVDLASFNPSRLDPQEIKSANYTGILTSSLFVEAQYSEREFQLGIGSGGPQGDLIAGTFIRSRGGDAGRVQYHSPQFCGDCETEERGNENTLVKGSYFLTTDSAGSHDIAFGYDTFSDIVFSVNHQSGSDYQVWSDTILLTGDANNTIYPVLSGERSWLVWWPVANLDIAAPTDFTTNSFYVNDSWQLNDKWSFNIGVRYDENDGTDSGGAVTVDDNKVSPRLGFTYDLKGDGDLVINGSYGTYVAAIANNRADSTSQGGQLAGFGFTYGGPPINVDCEANGFLGCTSTEDALSTVFDWYFANGGTDNLGVAQGNVGNLPNLIFSCIPGVTAIVPDTLRSPSVDELTFGATKRLGSKGLVRADVIFREWEDFYSNKTEIGNNVPSVNSEVTLVGNFGAGLVERDYLGVNLSGRYRLSDRLTVSGNYTWSELKGNIDGETSGSGPVPFSPAVYPEYKDPRWNAPVGPLLADQEHKLRVWGIYDVLDSENHSLSVSLLQNFFSGTPYSASALIDNRSFVDNPGYLSPPSNVGYFFSERGAFKSDDIARTDISLNYSFRWNALGKSMEVFIQPEIINVFNRDGVEIPGTTINTEDNTGATSCNGAPCRLFDPFNETPIEGVHWSKGSNFGQPTREGDFQDPRLFRLSVGFRF